MRKRILVVDDVPDWREILEEILTREYEVITVDNYNDAMDIVRNRDAELVIVDLRLSPTDESDRQGMELLRQLAEYRINAIVLTGYPEPELQEAAEETYKAFDFIDKSTVAGNYQIIKDVVREAFSLLESKEKIGKTAVSLLLPETMMNKSGNSVKSLVTSAKKAEKLVVIYDDIDLPLGTIRVAFNRGSGGHRGVDSIVRSIRTKAFIRIRIGVAVQTSGGKIKKPKGEDAVVDYLLGKFKSKELELVETDIARRVGQAIELIVQNGHVAAMNAVN